MRQAKTLLIALVVALGATAIPGCSDQKVSERKVDVPEELRVDKRLNEGKERIRQAEELRKANDQKAQEIISQ